MLLRLLLVGLVVTTIGQARALAQPAPAAHADADADKVKVAKQYVDAGLAAQGSGDYDTAITLYSKAYQLVPHPLLIFNMAQAHRLAGHVEQALSLYARYLAADPGGAGVGALGTVASLILLTRDPEPSATKARGAKPAVAIVPTIAPDGGGASLSLTW